MTHKGLENVRALIIKYAMIGPFIVRTSTWKDMSSNCKDHVKCCTYIFVAARAMRMGA